jgi:hypothetical protein
MQRCLFIAGLVLLAAAVAWPWLSRLPWGRLPGDIHVQREGFQLFLPLGTGLLISVLGSLLLWLLAWWWRR